MDVEQLMRIRLALTLNITRHGRDTAVDEPPYVDDRGYAATELSTTPPIGFHIQPTNQQHPFEDD